MPLTNIHVQGALISVWESRAVINLAIWQEQKLEGKHYNSPLIIVLCCDTYFKVKKSSNYSCCFYVIDVGTVTKTNLATTACLGASTSWGRD